MNKGQAEVSMCSNRNTKQTLRARRTEKLNTAWSSGGESRWAGWRFKCRSLALPFLFPLMRLHQPKKTVQINSSLANIWATCWTEVSEAKPSYIPALEHKWLAALYISNTPSNFNGSSPEHTALSDRTQRRASSIHLRTGVGDAIKLICLLTVAVTTELNSAYSPDGSAFRGTKNTELSFWPASEACCSSLYPALAGDQGKKHPKDNFWIALNHHGCDQRA